MVNESDTIRIANAQLTYYMHIANPEDLSDTEWAARVNEMEYIRRKESEANKT